MPVYIGTGQITGWWILTWIAIKLKTAGLK